MSQVIYRSQIKKYQNAPGPLPKNETEEEKKKRLEEEAKKKAAAQQTATATPATAATAQIPSTWSSAAPAVSTAQTVTTTQPATVTKPVGYLEINGIRATGDNATRQLNSIYAGSNDRFAQGIIGGLIANGGGAVVRGNKIILYDSSGKDVTSQYIQPGKTYRKTGFGRSLSATFNTSQDSNLRSLNQLIYGNISADPTEEPKAPTPTKLLYGKDWFSYNKDKDGKEIYNRDSQVNRQIFDTMRDAVAALWANDYDAKNYDLGDYAKNVQYIQALKDNFGGTEGFNNYLKDLDNRLAAGEEPNDNDIRILKLFGFSKGGNSTTGSGSGDSSETSPYIVQDDLKDYADTLKKAGYSFTKDKDGSYTLKGGIFGDGNENWSLWDIDDFKGTKYENGFYLNGKLYTLDQVLADPSLGRLTNRFLTAGADGADWNTTYNNMLNSGLRFRYDRLATKRGDDYYGGYTMYDPKNIYAGDIDADLRKNFAGRGVMDLSGTYDLHGDKVYAITDGQNANGTVKLRYMKVGPDGKLVDANINDYQLKNNALRTDGTLNWGKIDNNGYAPVQEFVTQEAGKAKQTNALMYNPVTEQYSLITNYDPEAQGAKGINISGPNLDWVKNQIKKSIESNSPWEIGNDKLSALNTSILAALRFKSVGLFSTQFDKAVEKAGLPKKDRYTQQEEIKILQAAKELGYIEQPSLKQGGKIIDWNRLQKLAGGGEFADTRSNKVVLKETKDLQHDISKAHTLEEGLTQSEQLRIAAAATDLGSMVASLFPGIQVVGAVGGATGTTMQLAADRMAQKEGRDVGHYGWRALANYAMDAVSAIPIAGGAAKIFKVGKNIQKIAPILAKAMRFAAPTLGAVGLTNAQAALGKIVSGKWSELTSNDFVDLLNGISAATGGAAVTTQSIKDARALTNLGDTAQAVAKDAKAIKEGKVGDVIFDKKTGEILEALDGAKTKAEALDKIKGFVKEKNSSLDGEALDNAAQSVFDALGLKEKAGKKRIKRDGWHFSREAGDARFEMGDLKLPQSTSMWNEMLNPKRIWMRDENLAKAMSRLSAKEINAANRAVKTRTYNPNSETESMGLFEWLRAKDTAQAISRMTVNNPQVFTNATFQVGKKMSPVHGVRGAFGTRQYRWAIDPRKAPKYFDFSKKTIGPLDDWKTSQLREMLEFSWPNQGIRSPYMVDMPLHTARTYGNGVSAINYLAFKQGGELPKFQDGGGFDIPGNGKKAKINVPAMMDLTSAIAQSAAIGKAYEKQREAIRLAGLATKTSPRIYGARFDVSPIDRQVEEAIDPYKQVQFNSSDNRENMAGELQRAKAISNIRERGEEQKTEAIDKFNTAEAQRASAQASQNAQVADANRAQAINAASTIAQSEAAEKNEKYAQVWNTFSQQFRQQARDAANKKAQSQYEFDAKQAENEYNEAIKNEFAELRAEYEKDPDKGNVTFETWVGSDTGRLNRYNKIKEGAGVINATNRYRTKLLTLQNRLYSDSNNFISFRKSGGKVEKKTTTKQSLSVNDRLTLQGDKAAKRAILQASNNLHKMLLKLMK